MGSLTALIPSSIKQKLKKKLVRTVYSATKPYNLVCTTEPELTGKNAVITGGSGAIGRAISFRLAAMGAVVYVGSRTEESAMKVVNEIRVAGLKAEPFIIDVSSEESIEKEFDRVFNRTTQLDILVNCAGGGARDGAKCLALQSVETIDAVVNTNLRGTMLCTRKAAQLMTPNRAGKIVIISSAVGLQGMANYSEYSAAKAGMFGFMKSMALELGPYDINVNCVTPGYIQRGEYDDNQKNILLKTNAMRKIGTLEDVAAAVAFMVGKDSGFITGQCLIVDGGRTLGLMGSR